MKLSTKLLSNDQFLLAKVIGGIFDITEERKDSMNVFEHCKLLRNNKGKKQYITTSKYSLLKNIPFPKITKYGIMSNISIKDIIKILFLIGLDIVKLTLKNVSLELDIIKTNNLLKSGNLRTFSCNYTSLFDQNETD